MGRFICSIGAQDAPERLGLRRHGACFRCSFRMDQGVEIIRDQTRKRGVSNRVNATLGLWWILNNLITVGASVDLPWSADADQKRTVTTSSTTFNQDKARVLGTDETREVAQKDVSFDFPLFVNAGVFFLWNPNFYSAVDVNYTDWSEFAFDVRGESSTNPFDGTPSGINKIDDTWSAHIGTGIALGEDPDKLIIDIAFNYMIAEDVQMVVPEQQGLKSDTDQRQIFISAIKRF
jgi:hypothetical protein